jgi:hypothetical protein
MAKIDNLVKLIERKNPHFVELVDALCNSEWVYKKTVDQFNKEGDELSFDSLESDTGDDSSYLSGRSSNPKVGRDQWQVNWVVEQILKGTLDVSPQTSENPDEIKEIKDEINAIYSDYVDFDDDEDDEYEDEEEIEESKQSTNEDRNIVNDIYDILLDNNKNTLVDNIDNQEVNLDTSTITFDAYGKKIEIIIKIKDIK